MNQNLILALLSAGGITVVDWGLGILVSLKNGVFSVQKLPAQLINMVLPYLGGSGILVILQGWATTYVGGTAGGSLPTISAGVAFGALGTYALKVLADVWTKLTALVPTQQSPAAANLPTVPPAATGAA